MCSAKSIPIKFTALHSFRSLKCQIDGRNEIVVCYSFVTQNHIRYLSIGKHRNEWIVDEMQHHDISVRVCRQCMSYFAFHSANLLFGSEMVRVVVGCSFDKEQINRPF